jgi:hypothetical protein
MIFVYLSMFVERNVVFGRPDGKRCRQMFVWCYQAPHEFVSHICNTKALPQFLPQLNNASMGFDGGCSNGKVTCVAFIFATQNLENVL